MREEILIKKLQNGDASALDELISMYYQEILRYCIWHAPDRTQAEDAAQETFLKAVKYLGNFGFSGKFRAFLYKIAANTCIDMQKNKWNQHTALEDLQEEPSYVEKDFKNVEEELVICSLVKNLELKDQEIVLLRFGQNMKLRAVQSRLKVSLKVIEKEMKGGNLR